MKKIFAANWKLFKTPKETRDFFETWKKQFYKSETSDILFFPPATSLEATSQSLSGTDFQWGSQNCGSEVKGAFTGEISAAVVKELGGKYILIGHSERRSLFFETNELIAQKLKLVQSLDLTPVLCLGETLAERKAGQTFSVLKNQLEKSLAHCDLKKKLIIAYEPVWAIGTGQVATAAQVQETHLELSQLIASRGITSSVPLLYGGSVKPDNARELIGIPHVDGFLVGGASLEVSSFNQICKSAEAV